MTGRGLANAYAQTLGTIFSSGGEKPYEVEIFVAEIGESAASDQIFRLTYDGQVADVSDYAAMGGQADSVTAYLSEHWRAELVLEEAVPVAVAALGHGESGDRRIPAADLEVAVLDRTRPQQRKFRRLSDAVLETILGAAAEPGPRRGRTAPGGAACARRRHVRHHVRRRARRRGRCRRTAGRPTRLSTRRHNQTWPRTTRPPTGSSATSCSSSSGPGTGSP